jgi:AraC-like DNA-binding protein
MKKKILVVEDEILIALDIKGILEDDGYEVLINHTVEDAICSIESHFISLVFIDINLNRNKDGIVLGNYLLEKEEIPYVYLTSYCDKETIERVRGTRPQGYIVKPFKDSDLIANTSIIINNYKHKYLERNSQNSHPIPSLLKEVIHYINDNLDKKIEIDELVQKTSWNKFYFIKVFSKFLGETPYQYILNLKMERAKLLLITDVPLSQIAFELGFLSYSNFNRAFKKIVDISPANYRKTKK